MKTLIVTLGRSLKALGKFVFLLFFFMGIGGIMSIDLLAGSLRGRCFVDPDQTFSSAVQSRLESQQVHSTSPENTCMFDQNLHWIQDFNLTELLCI